MYCKPLIIDYMYFMFAYGLFSCNVQKNFIKQKHFKKHLHVQANLDYVDLLVNSPDNRGFRKSKIHV